MAEPANCTFSPLKTPCCPPLELLELANPNPPDPASTPPEADDGPDETLLETLVSNWPALARNRFASACGRLNRAFSISRLFSSTRAMASRRERYMIPARMSFSMRGESTQLIARVGRGR